MRNIITLFIFSFSLFTYAQIRGKVIDKNNNPLPFVSIYLEDSFTGTTTNDNGIYSLQTSKKGKQTVVFQFLGFKTIRKEVTIEQFPFELNVQMKEKEELLDEVNVSSTENPANIIIRKAIANKEKNTNKSGTFTADFYSRGLFKVKNAPKKFLGQDVGDLGGGLDSARTGIIYLSETVSEIWQQKKPKKFKEKIIASKVSGDNSGISFNRAEEVNFDIYKNTIPIADAIIYSPIANAAFSYYKFKLEGSFYDKGGKLVDKIKLIPKRKNFSVFEGYIYIVEDDWAVYGADLTITGKQIDNPIIDTLHIKQNYNYDKDSGVWAIILQTIDFKVSFFAFKFDGRYSATYSNYKFKPTFTEKTFGKEILSFEKGATKKDSVYWTNLRSIPLTIEEKRDYFRKDSIEVIRSSKKYLDSIDDKYNKFKWTSPITGYSYRNRHKKWSLNYGGLLGNAGFNTVQGFNFTGDLSFSKRINDKGNRWSVGTEFNYGFSDKRVRPSIYFNKRWNNINKPRLSVSAGVSVRQFDEGNSISDLNNSLFSLFGKENYAKFYEKTAAQISFSQELTPDVTFSSNLQYANRKPLVNTTDYSFFNRDGVYETNNPISPDLNTPSFSEHNIFSAQVAATINFGSKYVSYPDSRYTVRNRKFPTLTLGYRKNFGAGNSEFNSDFLFAKANQSISLGDKGNFDYLVRGGVFLEQKDIPFMDFYHPAANETFLSPDYIPDSFFMMPYYNLSTNDKYAEVHTEYRLGSFLWNRVPILSKIGVPVIGAKGYFSGGRKPYSELSVGLDDIGFGGWKFLRVDFVQSNFNGVKENRVMFGIKIF